MAASSNLKIPLHLRTIALTNEKRASRNLSKNLRGPIKSLEIPFGPVVTMTPSRDSGVYFAKYHEFLDRAVVGILHGSLRVETRSIHRIGRKLEI